MPSQDEEDYSSPSPPSPPPHEDTATPSFPDTLARNTPAPSSLSTRLMLGAAP